MRKLPDAEITRLFTNIHRQVLEALLPPAMRHTCGVLMLQIDFASFNPRAH